MVGRILLLVLGPFLVHSDLRARDPGIEDEPDEVMGKGTWDNFPSTRFGLHHHTRTHGHHSNTAGPRDPTAVRLDTAPPTGETGGTHHPARIGNWCTFVTWRMVTVAVSCGTEKYTIKAQSPCPISSPGCQLVMYKLSTRPLYKEEQKAVSFLEWRCCPGHGGHECEDTVPDVTHASHPRDQTTGSKLPDIDDARIPGVQEAPQMTGDPNSEQNDVQLPITQLQDVHRPQRENSTVIDSSHHNKTVPVGVSPVSPSPPDWLGMLPLPQLTALLMAQLQPILDGFNSSLQRLSQDMAELRQERGGAGGFESKLEESFNQIDQLREQLRSSQDILEQQRHSQQALLHYNLTTMKMDTDAKIKRSQKTLQVNLQALNASIAEVKREQESLGQEPEGKEVEPDVWEAIRELNQTVVENTEVVSNLQEDQELSEVNMKDLQRGFRSLKDQFEETVKDLRVMFMETGLIVAEAKQDVLNRVNELAQNCTEYENQLESMESDIDYLFVQIYKNTSQGCDCARLQTEISALEHNLKHITNLAKEKNVALEEDGEMQEVWRAKWSSLVEDLQQGLQQVQHSVAFEQDRSRSLLLNISQLHVTFRKIHQELTSLQETDNQRVSETKRLSSSFGSLLKDAVRHTDVLELLLGMEVLEFIKKPPQDTDKYSFPALHAKLREMQEEIQSQNLSLLTLKKMLESKEQGDPGADTGAELADQTTRGLARRSGDHRPSDLPESPMRDRPDDSGSDPWALEKLVQVLGGRVSTLEKQQCLSCCDCAENTAPTGKVGELQAAVDSLRGHLKDHVQVFHSIFRNAEGLAASNSTLDLDRLWGLVKRKEKKRKRGRHQEREEEDPHRGHRGGRAPLIRSKKDAALEPPGILRPVPESPVMFLAGTQDGTNQAGAVLFERVVLNRGQAYSPRTGVFWVPADGVYLFVVTVDFGVGASLGHLKKGDVVVATLHQNQKRPAGPMTRVCLLELALGEQVNFELVQGSVENNHQVDNTFGGFLLFRTT
nr:PREDICTED: multimerin-2 isoform X1 [Lepisosteus oculatus]